MVADPTREQAIRFGKYQLLERLAVGGMAEIYKARYLAAAGVTKPVVIKKILPHYAKNPAFVTMFRTEAQIVVGLSHGNIAQVFDFGEVGGEWFLAMELVDGPPLSQILKRGRGAGFGALPVPLAVQIAREVARGLHYAHTRLDETSAPLEIVHRDVSPQNVIISFEGQVKIVDFGIAKAKLAGRLETQVGSVKGKYMYFAPEQARGLPLDARTDVFALGVVLYEMVCGRLPFEGKMMDVMRQIVHGELTPPRLVNPALPEALERILLTALATDPAARFGSAQAFHDALGGFLAAHEPDLSSASLAHWVQNLYAMELAEEGRAPLLPQTFLERLQSWKRSLGAGALLPPPIPDSRFETEKEEAAATSVAVRADPRRAPAKRRAWWMGLSLIVLATLAAALWASPERVAEPLAARLPGLHVPSSPAARIRLLPQRSYRVRLESGDSATRVIYVVEDVLTERIQWALLSAEPIEVQHADALYAFLVGDDGAPRAATVLIEDLETRASARLEVDQRHGIAFDGTAPPRL